MTTVLITGASMGIGRALARAWAERKATLVLSARNEDALADVARDVEARGGRAIVIPGDVTNADYRRELIRRATEGGGLDVLVNNAGRGYYASTLAIDLADLRDLFELNVFAPLELAQLAIPHLERTKGTIVMLSSVAGVVAAPRYGAYSATKFALEAIAMSMRADLAAKDIRVVVVRPGPVDTPFRANASRGRGEPGYRERDPKAQSAEDVAARTIQAVDKGRAIEETSNFVKLTSAAARFAPAALRLALVRMAKQAPPR
jgi:short-subunit dehydrogenase